MILTCWSIRTLLTTRFLHPQRFAKIMTFQPNLQIWVKTMSKWHAKPSLQNWGKHTTYSYVLLQSLKPLKLLLDSSGLELVFPLGKVRASSFLFFPSFQVRAPSGMWKIMEWITNASHPQQVNHPSKSPKKIIKLASWWWPSKPKNRCYVHPNLRRVALLGSKVKEYKTGRNLEPTTTSLSY